MPSELSFMYDPQMRPVSAKCTICGQLMPPPPSHLLDSADLIMWLSGEFLEHKRIEHAKTRDPDKDPQYNSAR